MNSVPYPEGRFGFGSGAEGRRLVEGRGVVSVGSDEDCFAAQGGDSFFADRRREEIRRTRRRGPFRA